MTAAAEGELLPPLPPPPPATPPTSSEPESVTLTCELCPETVTGPAGGRGSASFLLGRHRHSVHGVSKGKGRTRNTAKTPAEPVDLGRHGVVTSIHEAASQVKGTGVPRADQLGHAVGRGLSIASLWAAGVAVDSAPSMKAAVTSTDPAVLQQAAMQRDGAVRALSLSDDTARIISAPLGRLLAPTELNRKYGRALVDNTDLMPAVVELVDVGRNWVQFLAIRRAELAELRAQREAAEAVAGFVPPVTQPPTAPGQTVPTAAPTGPDPLGSGRIATPTYRTA